MTTKNDEGRSIKKKGFFQRLKKAVPEEKQIQPRHKLKGDYSKKK